MHLDDKRIALLRGDCATCASAFAAAESEDRAIAELLSVLDHQVPHVDPDEVALRARRGGVRAALVAPSIALIVLAGVASALPGSPVRSWFSRTLGGTQETSTVPARREQQGAFERPPSGVSVLPSGDFELVFEKVQESGVIRISLADQPEVSVHSDSGEVGYSVEPQGVTVLNSGSVANYQLALPKRAKSITIRVGDRIIFYKQEAAIETSAAQDAEGHYVAEFRSLSR